MSQAGRVLVAAVRPLWFVDLRESRAEVAADRKQARKQAIGGRRARRHLPGWRTDVRAMPSGMTPTEAWQGRADHNAQLRNDRSCFECGWTYTHDELRAVFGWDVTRDGWRCPQCSRRRRNAAREVARRLLAQADPRWELGCAAPLHRVYDGCLECEALAIAATSLLRRGALSRAEIKALTATVLSESGEAVKTCARERLAVPSPPQP